MRRQSRRQRKIEEKLLREEQQKDRTQNGNKQIVTAAYLFAVLFLSLMCYMVYFITVKSDEVINNSYNSRQELFASKVVRGKIISSNGEILAETRIGTNGTESRYYPYDNLFAHVVGYSQKGKTGIEALGNLSMLRSNAFIAERVKNNMAEEKNIGDNIITTLDVKLQKAAYEAMGIYKGAIVVTEPSTGKVLAMVSKPDYDPNEIVSIWDEVIADSESSILLNRAMQGVYPPGSTFKILTLLEYIRENPDYASYSYNCTGKYTMGEDTINCYHGNVHGNVNIEQSFAKSCNTSFANMGMSLRVEDFRKTCEDLLFNSELPLTIPYKQSRVYLDSTTSESDVLQAAIGQGKTQTTPIHMAMITSAIANGGILMKPYFIDEIQNYSGDTVKKFMPDAYGKLMTTAEAVKINSMMADVVQNGTGTKLKGLSYTAAGKTGSAEYSNQKGESHAWFTGFAPVEDPKIVITIILEGAGSGGDYAVPMAKRIFDAYLN